MEFRFNHYDVDVYKESTADVTVENVFAAIICSFGLLGNLMSIFVIVVLKEYKKSTLHLYVLQLAFADTLFLTTIPFKILQDSNNSWNFGEVACKAKEAVEFLNYYASIFFLMVMSLDRYIAVCHAYSTTLIKLRRPLSAWVVIAAVWFVSILACLPVIRHAKVTGLEPQCTCGYYYPRDDCENCPEIGQSLCLSNGSILPDGEASLFNDPLFRSAIQLFNINFGNNYTTTNNETTATTATTANYETPPPLDLHIINITREVLNDERLSRSCHYNTESPEWYNFIYVNFVLVYLLPIIVMVITYGFIIHRMHKTEQRTMKLRSASNVVSSPDTVKKSRANTIARKKQGLRTNKHVTTMCSTLVASFIILWFPFHAVHLAKIHGINLPPQKGHVCQHLSSTATIFGFLNSALNPYFYSFIGTNFAKRLRWAKQTIGKSSGNSKEKCKPKSGVVTSKGNFLKSVATYDITTDTPEVKRKHTRKVTISVDQTSF